MRNDDAPDGMSSGDIRRLLAEMARLADQPPGEAPALELLIGDIVTRTSIEARGADACLCVTAQLPEGCAHGGYALPFAPGLGAAERTQFELLRDADRGRYVLVRRMAPRLLKDERGVMDAILDTADLAQRCADDIGPA